MKIFYDCEFVDTGRAIEFLSMGLVREDGQELYVISDEHRPMRMAVNHDWLRDHVVPFLPVKVVESSFLPDISGPARNSATILPPEKYVHVWDDQHPDYVHVHPREKIAELVKMFILTTPNPQLWAWYGAYDHICLAQLFGSMQDLPAGVPMFTNDIKQEHVRLGSPVMPRQQGGEHNALADARHNRAMSRFLELCILEHQ
jgi:hypothetical protein